MFDELYGVLKTQDVEIFENYPISRLSSIRIGGRVSLLLRPGPAYAFVCAVDSVRTLGLRYKIIGGMTNILPSDADYDGVFISTLRLNDYTTEGNILHVSSGARLCSLARHLSGLGLGGYEELVGIPGSIGGLVVSNAGAFGKEISDILLSVTLYFPEEKIIRRLYASELDFSYRQSNITELGAIILNAELSLKSEAPDSVKKKILYYKRKREETQPIGKPSLGSIFKRPQGDYAARLIDACGLRGTRLGGAEISSKHAGFIVNNGGATSMQVKLLCELCEQRVFDRFGITLEREIEILN